MIEFSPESLDRRAGDADPGTCENGPGSPPPVHPFDASAARVAGYPGPGSERSETRYTSDSPEYRRAYSQARKAAAKAGTPWVKRKAAKAKPPRQKKSDPEKRIALAARGRLPAGRWTADASGYHRRSARDESPRAGAVRDRAAEQFNAAFGPRAEALAAFEPPLEPVT